MRVNITLDDKILERLDRYAKENGYKRSTLIGVCIRDFLDAKEVAPKMQKLMQDFLNDAALRVGGQITQDEFQERVNSQQVTMEELQKTLEK